MLFGPYIKSLKSWDGSGHMLFSPSWFPALPETLYFKTKIKTKKLDTVTHQCSVSQTTQQLQQPHKRTTRQQERQHHANQEAKALIKQLIINW